MSSGSIRSHVQEFSSGAHKRDLFSVLAVGDPDEWQRKGNMLPQKNLAFIAFRELSEAMLDYYSPSIIVSPVLANEFDCIELALLLRNLGFKGEYRAFAKDLPKPGLIEREVAQMCPTLNFKISLQS